MAPNNKECTLRKYLSLINQSNVSICRIHMSVLIGSCPSLKVLCVQQKNSQKSHFFHISLYKYVDRSIYIQNYVKIIHKTDFFFIKDNVFKNSFLLSNRLVKNDHCIEIKSRKNKRPSQDSKIVTKTGINLLLLIYHSI